MEDTTETRRSITPLKIIVIVIIIGVLAALFLSVVFYAVRRSEIIGCKSNLSQLGKMQNIYRTKFGGPEKQMYTGTGKDFWLYLKDTNPPLIETSLTELFRCRARETGTSGTDYRGPRSDVNDLGEDAPVGCDDAEHPLEGGGNVFFKAGYVAEYPSSEFKVLQTQCCE